LLQEHGSHGLATLTKEHVTMRGDRMEFCFAAAMTPATLAAVARS